MARTLSKLRSEIEKLQREAEQLQSREKARVVAEMREQIAQYGITAEDLGLSATRAAKATAKPGGRRGRPRKDASAPSRGKARATRKGTGAKKAGVIKFRDDEGNTWTGHGKRPNWFKAALEAGKTSEDLAVKN